MSKETTEKKEPRPKQPEQNGVTRPHSDTVTGRVWEIADTISEQNSEPATRKQMVEACTAQEINLATCGTQFGKWRKFNGLSKGRIKKADDDTSTETSVEAA